MSATLKRLASLLLAAVLVLALVPALADEEPIVITVGGRHAWPTDPNEMVYMKYLEEKFNVDLQMDWFFNNEALETQFTLLLADDNLPDLMLNMGLTKIEMDRYGQEGYFLDLSQYLDVMPDYAALLERDHALKAYSSDENGAIYGFYKTRGNECSREVSMAYMNNSWLENVGMEYPTTTEELYNVLKAFKEQDANGNGDPNDEIPFSFTFDKNSGTRVEYTIRSAFGIYGYASNYQLQATDGKVWLAETSENWKEYIKYMKRLYAEGLLDADCFIQTNDEYISKIRDNRAGYFGSWTVLDGVLNTTDLRCYLDYTFVTGFKSDLVDEIIYPLWNPVTATCVDFISADCANPEKICEIMNYFYTEQGMREGWIGADGVDCDYVEGAYGIITGDYSKYVGDTGLSDADWRYSYSRIDNAFMLTQYSEAQLMVDAASTEQLKAWLDEAALTDDPAQQVLLRDSFKDYYTRQVKTCDDYPLIAYTTEEAEERTIILTDVQNYIATMKAQFIIGELDIDGEWDNYLKNLNEMHLDRLQEIEQAAYDRYAANL